MISLLWQDRGKVFAFGPVPDRKQENLATVPPAGDDASIEIRRSILNWPTPFEVNFMTGPFAIMGNGICTIECIGKSLPARTGNALAL